MRRVMFEGCAGWLHEADGDTGVVLCAPQGHEMMWSHRAWRHLAQDLAAAGMPALRFDYPCTGDSAGGCDDPNQMARAVSSIVAAVDRLRAWTGVRQVVLCGMRLGATLATLAADALRTQPGNPVAGLVLLAPVTSGRAYLRELNALHLNWLDSTGPTQRPEAPTDGSRDVLAFRLPADAVQEISALRLDRMPACPAPRVWMLDAWPGSTSAVAALAQTWAAAGASVDVAPFGEYPAVVQSSEYAGVAEQANRQVVAWLSPLVRPLEGGPVVTRPTTPRSAMIDGVAEEAVWFDGGRQFGVLSTPTGHKAPRLVVIFPNTGGNHHVGEGRMFVKLARELARQGVAALRFDVSALGDSPDASRAMSIPAIYAEGPRRDVSAAVDWVRAQGFQRVLLAGVCSGAFLSLQAALANPGVDGLLLTNIVKFRWGRADELELQNGHRSWRALIEAACKPRNWRRLMRGDRRAWPLVVGMTRHVGRRLQERLMVGVARLHAGSKGGENGGDAAVAQCESVTEFAVAAMRTLNRRGVWVDFLYGANDVGLDEARFRFGRHLEALNGLECVDLALRDGIDHSLFLAAGREQFRDRLLRQVQRHLDALARPDAAGVANAAGEDAGDAPHAPVAA